MYSKEYVDYYNKNLWHKTYLKNDALLTCVPGSFNLNGFEDKMINLIMKEQLLKPELWELFANQFKIGNVDDANYGWKGEFWGKMMRGACITYKYCRSPELYSILENTVNEILSAQDSTYAFLSSSSQDKIFFVILSGSNPYFFLSSVTLPCSIN